MQQRRLLSEAAWRRQSFSDRQRPSLHPPLLRRTVSALALVAAAAAAAGALVVATLPADLFVGGRGLRGIPISLGSSVQLAGSSWDGSAAGRPSYPTVAARTASAAGNTGTVEFVTAQELELAAEQGMPLVVDFYADWCGPCQMLVPELNEVARRLAGRVRVLKVDTEVESDLATDLRIEALPTLLFFDGKSPKPIGRFEGLLPRDALETMIIDKFQI
mmetsp:Transcript_4395/g.10648  ORF Transcript_4395/g.10648 Transcript_4395/m.10648 type:complete len:218 (-) Transcript_4395:54-707(-)